MGLLSHTWHCSGSTPCSVLRDCSWRGYLLDREYWATASGAQELYLWLCSGILCGARDQTKVSGMLDQHHNPCPSFLALLFPSRELLWRDGDDSFEDHYCFTMISLFSEGNSWKASFGPWGELQFCLFCFIKLCASFVRKSRVGIALITSKYWCDLKNQTKQILFGTGFPRKEATIGVAHIGWWQFLLWKHEFKSMIFLYWMGKQLVEKTWSCSQLCAWQMPYSLAPKALFF